MWSSDCIIISLIKIIMDTDNTIPEGEMPEVTPGAEAPATDAPAAPEGEAPAAM
jgi:hypothetical protein